MQPDYMPDKTLLFFELSASMFAFRETFHVKLLQAKPLTSNSFAQNAFFTEKDVYFHGIWDKNGTIWGMNFLTTARRRQSNLNDCRTMWYLYSLIHSFTQSFPPKSIGRAGILHCSSYLSNPKLTQDENSHL
jgi:hypothetical protein